MRKFGCAGLLISMAMALTATEIMAGPQDVYRQAIQSAARGQNSNAYAMLTGAANVLHTRNIWRERMLTAAALLDMRKKQAITPLLIPDSIQTRLIAQYVHGHPTPEQTWAWIPGLLGTLFPGAGHAWLKRWHDAAVAAMLVWPMLLLTFWAWKRDMGPVTAFFALLTLWLWSGTVFSAVSLAERSSMEAYAAWWQSLWEFTGLPGRPW